MSGKDSNINGEKLTLFQKELHQSKGWYANSEEDSKEKELIPETIGHVFQHDFVKLVHYSPEREKLESQTSGIEVIYKINKSRDFLFRTFLVTTLPYVEVKEELRKKYRIAWTHNVGHNIVISAELKFDEQHVSGFDSHSQDIGSQCGYQIPSEFREHHNISIGSIPTAESWSDILFPHDIDVIQPFHYNRADYAALPILRLSSANWRHVYQFRLAIEDLLRMQRYSQTKQEWVDIKVNLDKLNGFKDSKPHLSTPELHGRYGDIPSDLRDYLTKCEGSFDHYYDSFDPAPTQGLSKYGDVVNFGLGNQNPIKMISWVAENQTARRYNYYSNYTTNAIDHNYGWNPFRNHYISNGDGKKVDPISSTRFSNQEAWNLTYPPNEAGYNIITYNNEPFSLDGVASKTFGSQTGLNLSLGNTDPTIVKKEVKNEDSSEEEEEASRTEVKVNDHIPETFSVRCYFLVYHKMSIVIKKGAISIEIDAFDEDQIWYEEELIKQRHRLKRN